MDLGAGRRGTDMGPSAIRLAGLRERVRQSGVEDVEDLGNIEVPQMETLHDTHEQPKHLEAIAASCRALGSRVRQVLAAGRTPIILGGDHSVAAGSVSGVSAHFRRDDKQIGLLWLDAHGDANTPETTRSGNVHGMILAALLGLGPASLSCIEGHLRKVAPDRTALVGVRDLDEEERATLRRLGCHVFTMAAIDERGIAAVMRDALRVVSGPEMGPFHVSFDVDAVDPSFAPGVGTPVAGGMTYREARLAMELVADTQRMSSMDVVEVNPILDERNRTGKLAMDLVLTALGKRLYIP